MRKLIFVLPLILIIFSCKESPDTISDGIYRVYYGGDIITMEGDTPQYAEAVVVKDGMIVFVGDKEEAEKQFGDAEEFDLKGRTMLPGFIDAHSHFSFGLNMVKQANLSSPPVGPVKDFATLIETLESYQQEKQIPEGEWLVGYGYDPNTLTEKKHITKVLLDKAFPKHKVMLIHVSGHGAVLNSKALEWAGIDENTETPEGGVIARIEGTNEPAGLLMETAYLPVFAKIPKPSEEEMLELLDEVQQIYASEGYTHAQDGACHIDEYLLLKKAADQQKLYMDIASLAMFTELDKWLSDPGFVFGEYNNHLKLQGIKIVQDGSPQGKTAYVTTPYLTDGPDGQKNWYGEPTLPQKDFIAVFKKVKENNLQVFVHVNGDAAIDDLIKAVEESGLTAKDDHRTVAIHSQFQRPEQLPKYKTLGITPSYFTNHSFFWGEDHIANRGLEIASFISPLNAAKKEGIIFSNHTDFNVTPINAQYVIWSAVSRTTRKGRVLGEDQRVDVYTALKAITTGPAYQLFEEDRKGMIKEGLLADFVILDKNPLKVETDDILKLKIAETIKEGVTIFKE